MKSLDRKSFEEQTRLVARYVAGDLSRSERAEFEAWLVASPELAAEVEMERRLRRGIASAARSGLVVIALRIEYHSTVTIMHVVRQSCNANNKQTYLVAKRR